jgi:hypothetical protein
MNQLSITNQSSSTIINLNQGISSDHRQIIDSNHPKTIESFVNINQCKYHHQSLSINHQLIITQSSTSIINKPCIINQAIIINSSISHQHQNINHHQ